MQGNGASYNSGADSLVPTAPVEEVKVIKMDEDTAEPVVEDKAAKKERKRLAKLAAKGLEAAGVEAAGGELETPVKEKKSKDKKRKAEVSFSIDARLAVFADLDSPTGH